MSKKMHENLQLACKQSQNFEFHFHRREFPRSPDKGSEFCEQKSSWRTQIQWRINRVRMKVQI